jgi:hypothetical protein
MIFACARLENEEVFIERKRLLILSSATILLNLL